MIRIWRFLCGKAALYRDYRSVAKNAVACFCDQRADTVQSACFSLGHQRMKTRAILSVLVAFLLSAPAMAEVYQYVDANGKTVFSDQPPPGARAKQLNVRASAAASAPVKASKTTALSDVEKKNAEIDAENAKVKEQNKKTAQENCKNARNNLAALQQGGRVKMPGSNALATDSQRSELLQAAQQNVASWCNK
ncbi:DUF4124 domain-containing protein [Aquitalea aquatilis]|uniref:DUF4124 domain-containing protein n=1 Tax=Aquitalea aquatilis TaxID=1537400 RepID=UPI0010BD5FE4|nr:DUF4124 domain-containing protein [Aquitalea aquatilis]